MEQDRLPRPGEIYNHFKDKPYQIIAVAVHTETEEQMVVYQALYGDFKVYVRPLASFLSEVDREKYPEAAQKHRFELKKPEEVKSGEEVIPGEAVKADEAVKVDEAVKADEVVKVDEAVKAGEAAESGTSDDKVSLLLMKFLDAESYYKKLEVLTSNRKNMNDRLINDMAVALDCTVDEGPLDDRIQGLINCLQAMCRFENKRLR